MPKTLEFFFDYASPYSYLASTQVESVVRRTGAELRWRPFLLGAVFKATGDGFFLYHLNEQCMALSMHLYYITTQASGAPKALPFAIAVVLLMVVLVVNALAIILRVYLRSRKKW